MQKCVRFFPGVFAGLVLCSQTIQCEGRKEKAIDCIMTAAITAVIGGLYYEYTVYRSKPEKEKLYALEYNRQLIDRERLRMLAKEQQMQSFNLMNLQYTGWCGSNDPNMRALCDGAMPTMIRMHQQLVPHYKHEDNDEKNDIKD